MPISWEVTIRIAEPRDLVSLGRLGAMLMHTHYKFDHRRFLAPDGGAADGYALFLGTILESSEDRVLVAEHGATIVGYAWAALEPMSWKELRGPAGFVHDVAVADEARRSGVAAKLMEEAIAWLRTRGAPRVILWSAAPNEAARSLFRGLGFRETMVEMTLELE